MNMHYVMMVFDIAGILGIILLLCGAYCLTFGSNDWRTERAGKILVIIGANLVISFVYGLYYDHNNNSDDSHSSHYSSDDKDLYDYKSWDYDGDGKMNEKETKDYLEFKHDMDKAANNYNY